MMIKIFRQSLHRNRIVNVHRLKQLRNMSSTDDVIFQKKGIAGIITLNRPKALNSFNLSMARKIYPQLKQWQSEVSFVIIKGSGEKAFCAGGDIKAVTTAGKNKDPTGTEFFQREYQTNHLIGRLKIPYVALIHGITMGGGVGLSVHGKYRVATEKTVFAMPETAIGLFPDVGGSFFLSRLPNYVGRYYGLTGYRLQGLDVLKGGIATHYCDYKKLPDLENELLALRDVTQIPSILNKYTAESVKGKIKDFILAPSLDQIRKHFAHNKIEKILESLKNDGTDWANKQIELLGKMSPTSLKVTLREIQEGYTKSFEECLKMEYRLVIRTLEQKDFYEGVRAVVIDKDQNPKWDPATLADVTDQYVDSFFAPLPPDDELKLEELEFSKL